WTALLVAWGVAVAGWIVVSTIPSQYEARAKIFVDAESVLKPLLQGLAVNTDVMNQVNMMSRVLMSRPNLEKVAQETDLALRAPTPEAFQRMVEGLPQRIGLNGGAGNVFAVSFQDRDPQMAYRVVKTLVDTFVDSAIGVKREDASGAQHFLKEQIADYEQKLRDAEDRLAQFKKENIGFMPGQTGDYYQRRQTASEELAKLKAQFNVVEQRRDELRRQLQGEEPTFGLFSGSAGVKPKPLTPVEAKIAELERERERLLIEYTEKHPRVRALDEMIQQLRQQKDPNAVAAPAPDTDPTRLAARALDVNPVYQNLKINLSQADLEVVELRNKITQQQEVVGDLQSKVNTIPEVEAQLSRLNRDYEVNRAQYQALLQRLESARLSEEAEGSREQVKFRVIEPPALPLVPLSPNRLFLVTAVLLAALAAGVGAAVLRNLINPVFSDRNRLASIAQVPVLGVVTIARGMSAAINGRVLQWAGGFAALAVVYVAVVSMSSRLAIIFGAMAR
ncbi:MAG TPA: XrtA system polysaccharide chain length determinant, partial [Steroidobacteraceae bacterium]|nr:XrtA system polysaccharide chain length determinant [Steroidobacteraceae bacterium]